jgi:hypothetical protein
MLISAGIEVGVDVERRGAHEHLVTACEDLSFDVRRAIFKTAEQLFPPGENYAYDPRAIALKHGLILGLTIGNKVLGDTDCSAMDQAFCVDLNSIKQSFGPINFEDTDIFIAHLRSLVEPFAAGLQRDTLPQHLFNPYGGTDSSDMNDYVNGLHSNALAFALLHASQWQTIAALRHRNQQIYQDDPLDEAMTQLAIRNLPEVDPSHSSPVT